MKKLIFSLLIMCTIIQASTLEILQSRLDHAIDLDSDRWLVGKYWGNLKILDVDEISDKKLKATGTFNTKTEWGAILTRHYTAYFKIVLDDAIISSCCWETAFGTNWCIR